jgi:hypothetical protein
LAFKSKFNFSKAKALLKLSLFKFGFRSATKFDFSQRLKGSIFSRGAKNKILFQYTLSKMVCIKLYYGLYLKKYKGLFVQACRFKGLHISYKGLTLKRKTFIRHMQT